MIQFKNVNLPDIEDILGWLIFDECVVLQQCVWFVSGLPGVLVEIGSYCGRSTVVIGDMLKQGCTGELYAIDPHHGNVELYGVDSFRVLKENVKRFDVEKYVHVVKEKSELYVDYMLRKVKLLFIDGDHEYHMVKKDYELWKGKIVTGGVVLFHDSFEDGPARVISEIRDNEFVRIVEVGSITGFRKV